VALLIYLLSLVAVAVLVVIVAALQVKLLAAVAQPKRH
jgi:hypothetical protein